MPTQSMIIEFNLTTTVWLEWQTIDLLYVHNSSVVDLRDGIFQHVTINNLQLSGCNIRRIAAIAFQGQEQSLKNLNLQVP